jgi:fructose-specific phosphotransferase system IIC component
MYFFDLRSPILEAFFFTASVGRLSFAAILAVGLLGKSFLSRLNSLFDHKPLMSFFFAIAYPFRIKWTNGLSHALQYFNE